MVIYWWHHSNMYHQKSRTMAFDSYKLVSVHKHHLAVDRFHSRYSNLKKMAFRALNLLNLYGFRLFNHHISQQTVIKVHIQIWNWMRSKLEILKFLQHFPFFIKTLSNSVVMHVPYRGKQHRPLKTVYPPNVNMLKQT